MEASSEFKSSRIHLYRPVIKLSDCKKYVHVTLSDSQVLEFEIFSYSGAVIQRDYKRFFTHSGNIIGKAANGDIAIFSIDIHGIRIEYVSEFMNEYPCFKLFRPKDSIEAVIDRMNYISQNFNTSEKYDLIFKNCNYFAFFISENTDGTSVKHVFFLLIIPLLMYIISKIIK